MEKMEVGIDYNDENQYVLVSFKNEITNEELIDSVKIINNFYLKNNFNKILIDCSIHIEEHHLINIYNLIRTFDILFIKHSIKSAVVLPDVKWYIKILEFYGIHSLYTGFNNRIFDNRDKALVWLNYNS